MIPKARLSRGHDPLPHYKDFFKDDMFNRGGKIYSYKKNILSTGLQLMILDLLLIK